MSSNKTPDARARQKALFAVTLCVLFWGFSFISIKIAVAVFPPMTLGAIRFALAVTVLFFIKRRLAPGEKISKADVPLLAAAGFGGVTLYFFFENNGVARIPASEASIIIGAIPVLTMICEAARDKILARKNGPVSNGETRSAAAKALPALGAVLSMAGVGLVAGVSSAERGTAPGYVFMAGAAVSWVVYCLLTRPLFARHSRVFIVFWQSLAGFLGFLPFAFFEGPLQMPGPEVAAHVLFLGVFCSALGYLLYAESLAVLGVGTSSIFINFIPVVSAAGGFFILGERLAPLQWLGAALVLAGVYLAMFGPPKPAGASRGRE